FKAAKLLFSKEDYFDVVLFHIQQAVEKYLKGYLIYKGWKLKKIHDIETLIIEAVKFDAEFHIPGLNFTIIFPVLPQIIYITMSHVSKG
ncbi:MAG: HEPN domain-containing protein, partial [Candidatus Methanofastidiosia archaeon]